MTREEHFDYMDRRGWVFEQFVNHHGEQEIVGLDPVDEANYDPPTALSIQLLRDIERVGGYEPFIALTGFEGEEQANEEREPA